MKNIQLRLAKKTETKWINNCYDKVAFVHSNFNNEIIAIAEIDNQKVGLGRLVTIDQDNLELGGIFVIEHFRGQGIAKEIVKFLLQHIKSQTIYCIPFKHLVSFYKEYGFIDCNDLELVPKELMEKYNWCKEKYTTQVALLILKK